MPPRGAVPALMLALVLVLAGCDRQGGDRAHGNDTAVLGGYGPDSGAPTLSDGQGRIIPAPPAPPKTLVRMARPADEQALAVWIAADQVVAAVWTPAGWSAPQPLERIHGQPADVQLTTNGRGAAMALWHHRVGNIHSLRFSRFDAAAGWSVPDVVPGALPRPNVSGRPDGPDVPQLEMGADGNVVARWPSGFHANEMQVARYAPATGWTAPANEPVASAPGAAPALAPASSAT